MYAPAVEYAESLHDANISIALRRKASIHARELYKRYCSIKMGSEGFDCKELSDIMDRLVDGMAHSAAMEIHALREQYAYSADRDISNYVKGKQKLQKFMGCTAGKYFMPIFEKKAVESTVSNTKTFNKDNRMVYVITAENTYHKLTCPICAGKSRRIMGLKNAVRGGYKPCSCISQQYGIVETGKTIVKKDSMDECSYSVVTAFVDESCRSNPWRIYDESLPKQQTSFSYVICKGLLESEHKITKENTLEKTACLARCNGGSTSAAIEAIHAVLEVLDLKYDFHGEVKIFTDNIGAVDKWDESNVGVGLGSLFDKITVSYIPRSENTVADSIGRKRVFADISKDTMKKVELAMHGENLCDDTIDYLESFFPEPDRDLPKLVSELENLSTAIGYLPPSGCTGMGFNGANGRIRTLLSSIRQGILVGAVV